MARKKSLGFGYIQEESKHHYLVIIPRSKNEDITVYERFEWDEEDKDEKQVSDVVDENLKVILSRHKWDLLKDGLVSTFNSRLKDARINVGRFKIGFNPVERLMGKEMVLLMWAIEDSDPSLIPVALKNWHGLSKEERWWLFTMANASTGHADDKRGWRKAIRFALTENPIEDETILHGSIFNDIIQEI